MHSAPLPGEHSLSGRAWTTLTPRTFVIGIAIAISGAGVFSSNPALVLLALAVLADIVRPHRFAGWQARSMPFLAAAAYDAPLTSLIVVAGLAAYRASGALSNRTIESVKWAILEVTALALGAMAGRALVIESASRSIIAYVLTASVLLLLVTLWSWVRARSDLFETRACIAEFGRYLPIKLLVAGLAGGIARYGQPGALLFLIPGFVLLAGLHVRDQARSRERSEMLQALCGILRYAHPYTLDHMRRVAQTADRVGVELRLGARHRARLAEAALLHDIGKVAVDERILEKPTRLDDRERAAVQRHSEMGAEIVAASLAKDPIVGWIRSHHERIDGTGYPDQLPAAKIPIESRIIAVIDAYDAMTGSKDDPYGRKYQPPISPSEARLELRRHSGTQFDPRVVEAFERVLEEGLI